ncbi:MULTISPECIES: hypothetical protein [Pseudomonas]|uniref:Uncharacterized protein n=1 Tax=Pseudomonas putida TaxID=303 RepID=A0A1L7NFT1_PSEPU|nr:MULTISPECIES: hypothetical protein [Pseudomonas]PYG96657.1 hypothetical protein CVV67_32035 [Arthrobacter stackebrandtii]MBP2082447.1 hypothetical protein [Pseudomonas sp. PvP089]MBP2091934.1 hypothetical protein [Pseudomonas sp. PvP088]MBP2221903.1 hypothetical protein [Pseudomonas putida]WPO32082.1 hypothetical protein REH59_10680 [Pseudomonas sp. BO3-4]
MIQLTGINRNAIHLAPAAIASVTEAGSSSQWHGICAIVRTFDGQVLEVRDRADDIVRQIKEAR